MMKNKSALCFSTLLTGLLLHAGVSAGEVDEYKAELAKTEAALEEIARTAQLWTTSGELLKSARNAAEGGHFDRAIELVKEARLHGELALATARREKQNWQRNVPK